MRDPENIMEVAACNPDYMGFIFYKESKRYVGKGFHIPEDLPATIKRVGVFADDPIDHVMKVVEKFDLDVIQLHGGEPIAHCEELAETGCDIMKVFAVNKEFDFDRVKKYRHCVDFILFDTKGLNLGGNGIAFDWKLLEKYDQKIPFFLSGGLSPKNVAGISMLKGMNFFGVDVNSGVEREVGIKDVSLIREFQSELKKVSV